MLQYARPPAQCEPSDTMRSRLARKGDSQTATTIEYMRRHRVPREIPRLGAGAQYDSSLEVSTNDGSPETHFFTI